MSDNRVERVPADDDSQPCGCPAGAHEPFCPLAEFDDAALTTAGWMCPAGQHRMPWSHPMCACKRPPALQVDVVLGEVAYWKGVAVRVAGAAAVVKHGKTLKRLADL